MRAYVKRKKNDAADAEAICESVRRPTMRFVRAKSAERQGRLMRYRTRDLGIAITEISERYASRRAPGTKLLLCKR